MSASEATAAGETTEVPLVEAIGATSSEEPVSEWLDKHDTAGDDDADQVLEERDLLGLAEGIKKEAEAARGDDEEETVVDGDTKPEASAEDAAATEEETPESGEEDGDYEKAISALRYARLSKEVIGKLSRAEVLKEGLAMAEGQATTNARFDEHSKQVNDLKDQLSKKESGEERGSDVESAREPSPVNLGDAGKAFAEALGLSEEQVGPALTRVGEAITGPIQKQMADGTAVINKQITEGIEVIGMLDRVLSSVLYRGARAELVAGEYPQLKEANVYAPIEEKAKQLVASGSYAEMDPHTATVEALTDAAGIKLRPGLKAEAKAEATRERVARDRGAIRRPGSKKSDKELTDFEKASSTLDKLEAAEAQR